MGIIQVLVSSVLAASWVIWLVTARLGVYAVTDSAQLRTLPSPTTVQVGRHGGVVEEVHMRLGQHVEAGDLLVKLEVHGVDAELLAETATAQALEQELKDLRRQMSAQQAGLADAKIAFASRAAQARAEQAAAAAKVVLVEHDLERRESLAAKGFATTREAESARFELDAARTAHEAAQRAVETIDASARLEHMDRENKLAEIAAKVSHAEGSLAVSKLKCNHYARELEHYAICADIGGTIASIMDVGPGSFVDLGDVLGTIVPDAATRIVAQFDPVALSGRIQAGQRATLRLGVDGMSAIRGMPATVSAVASDLRDGLVRVELKPDESQMTNELGNGLVGRLEIRVDERPPLSLLLSRAADVGRINR
jgi:membrane fusion protein (multidrug efflux system)